MNLLSTQPVTVIEPAANDLPATVFAERARRRERDRKLRGPAWSAPERTPIGA